MSAARIEEVPEGERKVFMALDDPETHKILEDSPQNLLLDRLALLTFKRLEGQMRTLMAKRAEKGGSLRKMSVVSDHYTFMFELQRRLKFSLKRLLEPGSLSQAQNVEDEAAELGPGGCRISPAKFKREFPNVDLEKLDEESLTKFLTEDVDPGEDLLEELGGTGVSKRAKPKAAEGEVKKRGRPPKRKPIADAVPVEVAKPDVVMGQEEQAIDAQAL